MDGSEYCHNSRRHTLVNDKRPEIMVLNLDGGRRFLSSKSYSRTLQLPHFLHKK